MIARSAVTRLSYSLRVGDFLRDDRVVLRLRLVGVGDRRDADLEIALRLRELLRHGGLLAVVQLDVELREQDVEIRVGDAQDQVLLRDAST